MTKRLLLLVLLILPTFALMLRGGIYSMHDFHVFRQYEFNQCILSGSFPCRWAPDSSRGFGQPLFNFYGQIPYWLGTAFAVFGVLASVKILFIFTLMAAAISMFAFARSLWGNRAGLLAALVYTWAPYRAVDVWVRGALNEALAFVFYPLILWAALRFVNTRKFIYAGWTSLLMALLLCTHNISFVMFIPFLAIVVLFELRKKFNWHTILDFISIFLGTILLSAFYLFPVIAESALIALDSITQGYYGYQLHWATLNQLFISRFWGYGGSTWGPNDTLSFALGYIIWIPVVLLGIYILIKRFKPEFSKHYLLFAGLTALAVFLTHGKSEIIWKLIPILAFVQFPWRFLAMAVFFGSLTAGLWGKIAPKIAIVLFIAVVLVQGVGQFRPDIWRNLNDSQYFTGDSWNEQRSSALTDFWPKSAKFVPDNEAFTYPILMYGTGDISSIAKIGSKASFTADITSDIAKVKLPIIYFPGWQVNYPLGIDPQTGLITVALEKGHHDVQLRFIDTWPRTIGNLVSLLSLGILLFLWKKYDQK